MKINPDHISSTDAETYGDRFVRYMKNQLFRDDEKLFKCLKEEFAILIKKGGSVKPESKVEGKKKLEK